MKCNCANRLVALRNRAVAHLRGNTGPDVSFVQERVTALVVPESEKSNQFMLTVFFQESCFSKVAFNTSVVIAL